MRAGLISSFCSLKNLNLTKASDGLPNFAIFICPYNSNSGVNPSILSRFEVWKRCLKKWGFLFSLRGLERENVHSGPELSSLSSFISG